MSSEQQLKGTSDYVVQFLWTRDPGVDGPELPLELRAGCYPGLVTAELKGPLAKAPACLLGGFCTSLSLPFLD